METLVPESQLREDPLEWWGCLSDLLRAHSGSRYGS